MSRELQALAVVLLILAAGWVGYGLIFADAGGGRLVLSAVEGPVGHIDPSGVETPATAGTRLLPMDRIVAGAGGRAVVALGAEARVTVEPESALRVLAVDEDGVSLELEEGRVQATIHPGAGKLGIRVDGRTLTTDDADFSALRAADGTLAVNVDRGGLDVAGVDGVPRIAVGDQLVDGFGEGVALLGPASEELLLQVAWPTAERTQASTVVVHGKTEPGAAIRFGRAGAWVEARADAAGAFTVKARLTEGVNEVHIEATSLLGTRAVVAHAIVLDTTAPSVGVQVIY